MTWNWLRSWWRGTRVRPRLIQFYTRHGCHLCDDSWEVLQQLRTQYGFVLEKVDVDSDVELVKRYGECVPVVVIDGKVRFRGRINPVLLGRLFR